MSQTNYNQYMNPGRVGGLFDSGFTDKLSVGNALGAIPYGSGVCRDLTTTPGQPVDFLGKLGTVSGDVANFIGVALNVQTVEQPIGGSAAAQYPQNSIMSVLHEGRCWVQVEEAVTAGDVPSLRITAGGNGIGTFAKTADAARIALTGKARYITSALANGLAVIEILKN